MTAKKTRPSVDDPIVPPDPLNEYQDWGERLLRDYADDTSPDGSKLATLAITGVTRTRLIALVTEMRNRKCEALSMYKPLAHLSYFHAGVRWLPPERIIRGSNRGGKTLTAAVECARAVTGHPDACGRYPKRDGRCIVVGKDGRHNSEVLYRKLFRFGAFKMIEETPGAENWVSYNPMNPEHRKRESEAKPAPPLIPLRMIRDIAWENKKESSPRLVRLTNGWEMTFYSSLGKPPQGLDVDYAWFDEEIADGEWYPEISARLIDRNGKFIWSATAQLGGAQLYELCERADKIAHQKKPSIVQWFAHLNANKHFSKDQRELFAEKLTEEQARIRIEGEWAFTAALVYPEFDQKVHGCKFFEIPVDWTRYMVVDPGRQVCAVLFAAVPPRNHELRRHVFFYDELYIANCSAKIFGERAREKTMGQNFHRFIIDHHGSRVSDTGGGENIEDQYSRELKRHGVKSRTTGSGFDWGDDDVDSGIEKFRSWLLTDKGTQKLRFFPDKMPMFSYEISRYRYKQVKDFGTRLKPEKKNDHLMDLCRYLALYEPRWVSPKRKHETSPHLLKYLDEKQEKNQEFAGINLGPGK